MTNPKTKGNGAGIQFLRANVNYVGDECLRWPLSCDDHGHAIVYYEGRGYKAARVMCTMTKGPPPTPQHETAHSCGKGHEGCVNPNHLSWKTRSENQQDRRLHGTQTNAVWGCKGRLTVDQVRQIKSLKGQKTEVQIGAMFGCTPTHVNKIHNGHRWKGVQ